MNPNDQSSTLDKYVGRDFGPYRVQRLLGKGAFGAVFEAIKQPLGKRVAIKILLSKWAEHGLITARFIREAQAAASLRHAHIVDVDDIGTTDGVPWIAMEYLEGESLSVRLEREAVMPVTLALEYMLPILSAVMAIHAKGIIHRDLKPENIQLWRSSAGTIQPKLLDFGIAKLDAEGGDAAGLTGATEIMGTPEYMAPEQWQSAKSVKTASDQWALAIIIYRLVTGVSPFKADTAQDIMFRVSMDEIAPFGRQLEDNSVFESVLLVALNKDQSKRYPSVRAFGAALLPFADLGVQKQWRPEFGHQNIAGVPSAMPDPVQLSSITPIAEKKPTTDPTLLVGSDPSRHLKPSAEAVQDVQASDTPSVTLSGPFGAIRRPNSTEITLAISLLVLGAFGAALKFRTPAPASIPTLSPTIESSAAMGSAQDAAVVSAAPLFVLAAPRVVGADASVRATIGEILPRVELQRDRGTARHAPSTGRSEPQTTHHAVPTHGEATALSIATPNI